MVDVLDVPQQDSVPKLSIAACEAAFRGMLAHFPEAPVSALDMSGRYVEMPASISLSGQQIIAAQSSMHFVIPADRKAVTDAFHRVVTEGVSRATVHLASDPERTASFNYFDLRANHGVFVLVLADYTGNQDVHAQVLAHTVTPRFCRTRKSETSVFLDIDESTSKMLGWSREEMIGRRSVDFIHPDDEVRGIDSWMEMAAVLGASSRARVRHLCADGSWRWLEITNTNHMDDPTEPYVAGELVDISDEMAALESVRTREQLLDRIARALPIGLFQVAPDRSIVYTNDRLHQIVGKAPATTLDDQMVHVVPEDRSKLHRALDGAFERGEDDEVEVRLKLPGDTRRRLCTITIRVLTTDAGSVSGAIVCVTDVTESAQMRRDLERQAMFDPMTECHNRRSVMSALDTALANDVGEWSGTAVMFVDIDSFKLINDTYGHAAGDEALTVVADRLRRTVGANGIIGRMGGDEFLVVCPRVAQGEVALHMARRIADTLGRNASIDAGIVALRASIGVAWTRSPACEADVLVREADLAMYESKRLDRGRPVLFDPTLCRSDAPPSTSSVRSKVRGCGQANRRETQAPQ